jgi:glycerol-3-phosphate dehydrogenase (NAD(P)+)
MSARIAVLGGGAWGTALACVAARAGSEVTVWTRKPVLAAAIAGGRNPDYLPDIALPDGIAATADMGAALRGAEAVLIVVPAQSVRAVMAEAAKHLPDRIPAVLCAKGVERESLKRMTQVLGEAAPGLAPCVLSGPTFAGEVARGLPAAVTLAAADAAVAERVQAMLGGGSLRAYLSDDPVGAEIGGAVKNVVALAAGIAMGRGLGENARAALVSRGLAEMTRLAVAEGGRAETVMGLSGLGDLVLTAMSPTSRNTAFGMALGEVGSAVEVMAGQTKLAEGVFTAQAVAALAARHGIEMPICATVTAILEDGLTVDQAVAALLERPPGREF